MNILITGGTGFIGSALLPKLKARGDKVWVLTRQSLDALNHQQVGFNYVQSLADIPNDQHIDTIINLAGEPLAGQRWNRVFKQKLLSTRVSTTTMIGQWLSARGMQGASLPTLLLSGSAIGFYGARGDEALTEDSPAGQGFASELCQQWERVAQQVAQTHSLHLCLLRIGVVLDKKGGAFEQMRAAFDKKVAAKLGSGKQYLSWIHREDLVRAILFILDNKQAHGTFNLTAPEPVTNAEFTRTVAQRIRTWFSLTVPSFVLKLLVGEMANELLLTGQKVIPEKLIQSGFEFKYPTLALALDEMSFKTL